jgi:hypothetical protein
MTVDAFRQLALSLPGASESAHMGHPDFRAGGKIFATLGAPDDAWGMVKLTPEQQRTFVRKAPRVFVPCNGAWGRHGCTSVLLRGVTPTTLKPALKAAWENVTAKAAKKSRPSL